MKSQIILLSLSCLCIFGCQSYYGFTKSYEMSVKVIDVLGNPIKNREVRLFIDGKIFSHDSIKTLLQPKLTATTNNLGEIKFNYDLTANDFDPDIAKILVKEDSNFIALNAIVQPIQESSRRVKGVIKVSGTIKMDSFVPFKVQIKSNRSTVNLVALDLHTKEVFDNFQNLEEYFNWSFVSFRNNRYPATLDTTITTRVCLRTSFIMDNYIKLSDGTQLFGNHLIDSNDIRQILFVNEIK